MVQNNEYENFLNKILYENKTKYIPISMLKPKIVKTKGYIHESSLFYTYLL